MDRYKNNILTETFPNMSRRSGTSSSKQNKGIQYYAIAQENQIIKRFKLILRNGSIYSLPYSLLPYYILTSSKDLVIKAYDIFIMVKGTNLDLILEHLSQERLIFLKESPSGINNGISSNVFVENITIEGEALQLFKDN